MDVAQPDLFLGVGNMFKSTKRSRAEDEDELDELRFDRKVNLKRVRSSRAWLTNNWTETSHPSVQILTYNEAHLPFLPVFTSLTKASPYAGRHSS